MYSAEIPLQAPRSLFGAVAFLVHLLVQLEYCGLTRNTGWVAALSLRYRCYCCSGDATFFWLDHWLGESPLATTFPALFSHYFRPNSSVAMVLTASSDSLSLSLRPRLTSSATSELLALRE